MKGRWGALVGLLALGLGLAGMFWVRGAPPSVPPPARSSIAERVAERVERLDGPAPTEAGPDDAYNVVLLIACTLRKDQVSIYDPSLDTMPYLRSLAERGAAFADLVTAAPWTKAASTAILTGHHALEVGMVEEGPRRNEKVLPSSVVPLAERFREAGYRTVGATANPNLHSNYGFERGFQSYRQPRADWAGKGGAKVSGVGLAELLLADLDATTAGRPFYLQAMFVDAHAPYPRAPAVEGLPRAVSDYRQGLTRLDDAIRTVVEGLEARGLLERTVVAVVNDHGEGLRFPDHHGKSHGRYLAPSTVGGVAVMVGPGIPAGRWVEGMASQVDLAPTLWSLAGLEPLADGSGLDVAAVVRGASPRVETQRVYADTWFRAVSRVAFYEEGRACQMALDGPDRTDVNGVTFQPGCFDRQADPLHASPTEDRRAMMELVLWRQQAAAKSHAIQAERRRATGGLDEQLEALGYVD